MEAARLGTRGRRLRRGTVERPLNSRLVRVGFVVVVPALLAFLFSISTTGTLPRSTLEPLFDGAAATTLASSLSTEYPSRVPGSEGAADATRWYAQSLRTLGLTSEEDTWTETLADLGRVQLTNVTTVIPGRSDDAIVVVAHRDNAGAERSLGDNASGTAALLELARGFAPPGAGVGPVPEHTLVLVSTDGGAYGGAGAERFAETSPYAKSAVAVVVLDGLAGRGQPRIAVAGDSAVSPSRTLVRTAAARVAEETGTEPELAGVPTQLLDLGMPFAAGEQGRFLGHHVSAVTITTDPAASGGDPDPVIRAERLTQLGRAAEALLDSLDASAGGTYRTPDSIFFSDRAASGWSVRLVLVVGIVPFALGLVDLLVRVRRRRLPLAPAVRALRARVGLALLAGALVWIGALVGLFPTGAPLPLPPYADIVALPPIAGLLALAAVFVAGWLVARRRLRASASTSPADRLTGLAVGLALLGIVALALAVAKPYALVFVLPSLYAWLWLPLEGRTWQRAAAFAVGLAGPIAGVLLLARELVTSPLETVRYVVGLATVGYVPVGSVVAALVWLAVAAQVGALAFGRYAPYAGGAEPPPPGVLRRALRRER
jgi:Peptidase family M28